MKKILYTIGFLMIFSGAIRPMLGIAANPTPSTANNSCDATRDSECLRQLTSGMDWGQSFGETDPKKVGKDLYSMIYTKMTYNPMDEAVNQTAAQYGILPAQMTLILEGDVTPILQRQPGLTIEAAERIYRDMLAAYTRNKNESDLVASLKAETDPAEIFANGDISDSGFDLINDLNNIEIILFKKADLVSFGGSYSPKSGGGPGSGGTSAPAGASGTPSGTSPTPGGSVGSSTQPNQSGTPNGTGSASNPYGTPAGLGQINPNICFIGDDLKKALDALEQQKNANAGNNGTTGTVGPGSSSAAGPTGGGNTGGVTAAGGTSSTNASNNPAVAPTPVAAAPAGDYKKNPLCGEIFCLTLDFISAPVKPGFYETDNCIACHLEYINDKLQKTISHDLTPSKAPGNFGETSICKSAAGASLGNIGLNVAYQAVPIVTPTKDDLMTLSSTTEEWNKFWAANAFWNYSEEEKKRLNPDYNNQLFTSLTDEVTQQVLAAGPDNQSLTDVGDKIQQSLTQIVSQQSLTSVQSDIGSGTYNEAETQNDLAREMQTMNSYFGNIRNIVRGLSAIVPGVNSSLACQKLKEKKACT